MKPPRPAGAGTTIRSKCSASQSRLQRVDGRPAALDPRVDRNARAQRGVLDRLEQRHRRRDLLLHRRVLRLLERHDDQVGGNERRVLGAGDPDPGGEHGRVERAAGERDEDPLGAAGCDRRAAPAERDSRERRGQRRRARRSSAIVIARGSSRSARSATTRMSTPGSSRTSFETSEPRRISVRRDSSGVPRKTYVEPRSATNCLTASGRLSPSTSMKCAPRMLARRRSAASDTVLLLGQLRPGPANPERVDLGAEPLAGAEGAAQDPLRARLGRDEHEDPLGDRLLAQRVEHGRRPARLDVLGELAQDELAERGEVVEPEEVRERGLDALGRVDLAVRGAGPGAPRASGRRGRPRRPRRGCGPGRSRGRARP